MTDGDQTRKEVFNLTADFVTPKTTIKVGYWNVRTLFQTGILAQIIHGMTQNKSSLLGITEARWTGAGETTLATGKTILRSGKKYNQHREGAALVIGKEQHKTLLECRKFHHALYIYSTTAV